MQGLYIRISIWGRYSDGLIVYNVYLWPNSQEDNKASSQAATAATDDNSEEEEKALEMAENLLKAIRATRSQIYDQ